MDAVKCFYPGCNANAEFVMVLSGERRCYCNPHFALAESVALKAKDVKAIMSRRKLTDDERVKVVRS